MKSSTSSKNSKPQRKRSEAADTAEVVVEIAATAVAVGDKAVVAGEEEAGARRRREPERGNLYAFTKTILNNTTIPPVLYCLRRWFRRKTLFPALEMANDLPRPLLAGRWQIC